MDEAALWLDMPGDTTVTRTSGFCSHCWRLTVILSAVAIDRELKPIVMFKGVHTIPVLTQVFGDTLDVGMSELTVALVSVQVHRRVQCVICVMHGLCIVTLMHSHYAGGNIVTEHIKTHVERALNQTSASTQGSHKGSTLMGHSNQNSLLS